MLSAILAPLYKYIAGGALIACLVLGIALKMERAHSHKVEAQLVKCSEARKADSTAKNEQKAETAERVRTVVRTIHDADQRAKVIESAPLRGECRTPDAILGADL